MLRVAVLASGRGSNLAALIQAQNPDWQVLGVFSDKPDCNALKLAAAAGLIAVALKPRDYDNRAAFDHALFTAVESVQPDLIVCAGYMRIISSDALARIRIPMINIHPSLLPRHRGLDTHARALAAADSVHGCSVHQVIPELDAGPVLAQARLAIHAGDTVQTLARRVLELEHRLLPACVDAIAKGRIRLQADAVHFEGRRLHAPLRWQNDSLQPER